MCVALTISPAANAESYSKKTIEALQATMIENKEPEYLKARKMYLEQKLEELRRKLGEQGAQFISHEARLQGCDAELAKRIKKNPQRTQEAIQRITDSYSCKDDLREYGSLQTSLLGTLVIFDLNAAIYANATSEEYMRQEIAVIKEAAPTLDEYMENPSEVPMTQYLRETIKNIQELEERATYWRAQANDQLFRLNSGCSEIVMVATYPQGKEHISDEVMDICLKLF